MATATTLYSLPIAAPGDPADGAGNEASMMNATEIAIRGQQAIKPTDQTVTSTVTPALDTALFLPVVGNATYEFYFDLIYGALAAAGLTLLIVGPASATATWSADGLANGVVISSGIVNRQDQPLGGSVVLGSAATTATNVHAYPRGILKTAGTAGNLQLEWAQGTSNATGTIMRAGSILKMKRIV